MDINVKTAKNILIFVILNIITLLFFVFIYNHDNKYTTKTTQPISGVLILNQEEIDKNPIHFLINQWEYYSGVLLTDKDFYNNQPIPDKYVSIGQYGSTNSIYSKHNSGTYRLNIIIPPKKATYSLYIPEIYSSYKLYINGNKYINLGDTNHLSYKDKIQNQIVTFEASSNISIIISTTNYSYIYSGMVYPIAFGSNQTIQKLLITFIFIRTAILCLSLIFCILSFYMAVRLSYKQGFIFSIICFCFIGYTSYPLIHTFFETSIVPFYCIELFSYYFMLLLIIVLQNYLIKLDKKTYIFSIIPSIVICILVLIFSNIIPLVNFEQIKLFSYCLIIYKISVSIYLLVTSILSITNKVKCSLALLYISYIFGLSLALDRIFYLFEPIYTGWFSEISGLIIVIVLAFTIWNDMVISYRQNIILKQESKKLEYELEMQQEHFNSISNQIELARTARHDIRHHMAVISQMLQDNKIDEISNYISTFSASTKISESLTFCNNYNLDVVLRHFYILAKDKNIDININAPISNNFYIVNTDLSIIFCNILENAIESCDRSDNSNKFIDLKVSIISLNLIITLKNTSKYDVNKKHNSYMSSKKEGRKGIGLSSVKSIVKKYNGDMKLDFDKQNSIFVTQIILRKIAKN